MPRLSVDIDLTYLPIGDRSSSLAGIGGALDRIKNRIEVALPGVRVLSKPDSGKLAIRSGGVDIKVEVNLIKRGTVEPPAPMALCGKARREFGVSVETRVVSFGELYGGKICAPWTGSTVPRNLLKSTQT